MRYIIAFILTFILTFIVKKVAIKKSLLDIPNKRSSHSVPTPRGGGLAIVIVWYAFLSFFYYKAYISQELFFALLPGIIIAMVGFFDDILGLSPKVRLFFQGLVSLLALYFLGGLQKLDLGFFIFDNIYLLSFFAFFGIIWFINLFNFLDGIDGYEASEVIFISLSFFCFAKSNVALLLANICFGFLFWNWQKAKIFMGDVGSTLLGYSIAVFIIYFQNNNTFSLLNSLIITAIFWFDASLTLFIRWKKKEKLSQAHKNHTYQKAVQIGFSHQKVVILAMLINIILLCLTFFSLRYSNLSLLIFVFAVLFLYEITRLVDKLKANFTK